MKAFALVMVVALTSCADNATRAADAGVDGPRPDAAVAPDPDFFGEACVEAPAPTVTVCRDFPKIGWCVDGICRPQCQSTGPACPVGIQRYSDRRACYCSPN